MEVPHELIVEDPGADLKKQEAPRGVQRICCLLTKPLADHLVDGQR